MFFKHLLERRRWLLRTIREGGQLLNLLGWRLTDGGIHELRQTAAQVVYRVIREQRLIQVVQVTPHDYRRIG